MLPRLSAFALSVLAFATALPAQDKRLVTPKDLGKWESLGAARLSPNGLWMSYGIARGNEENELRLRGGARDSTVIMPYGVNPSFSADSKWLAYLVGVAPKERDRLLKDKKPVRTALAVRNLATSKRSRLLT